MHRGKDNMGDMKLKMEESMHLLEKLIADLA